MRGPVHGVNLRSSRAAARIEAVARGAAARTARRRACRRRPVRPAAWLAARRRRATIRRARRACRGGAQAARRRRHRASTSSSNDGHVAGGILAGALAYRMFIWLLPAALVAVAGLGVAADAAGKSPTEAANTSGLAGLVTSSVSSAAESPTRWYALLIGIPVLVYMTRSLLRTLIAAHRLVWADIAARGRKPKLGPTLQLLAVLVGYFIASALAAAARDRCGRGRPVRDAARGGDLRRALAPRQHAAAPRRRDLAASWCPARCSSAWASRPCTS